MGPGLGGTSTSNGGNQPDKVGLPGLGQVARRWQGGMAGMGMVVAKDPGWSAAQRAHGVEANLRVYFKTLMAVIGRYIGAGDDALDAPITAA